MKTIKKRLMTILSTGILLGSYLTLNKGVEYIKTNAPLRKEKLMYERNIETIQKLIAEKEFITAKEAIDKAHKNKEIPSAKYIQLTKDINTIKKEDSIQKIFDTYIDKMKNAKTLGDLAIAVKKAENYGVNSENSSTYSRSIEQLSDYSETKLFNIVSTSTNSEEVISNAQHYKNRFSKRLQEVNQYQAFELKERAEFNMDKIKSYEAVHKDLLDITSLLQEAPKDTLLLEFLDVKSLNEKFSRVKQTNFQLIPNTNPKEDEYVQILDKKEIIELNFSKEYLKKRTNKVTSKFSGGFVKQEKTSDNRIYIAVNNLDETKPSAEFDSREVYLTKYNTHWNIVHKRQFEKDLNIFRDVVNQKYDNYLVKEIKSKQLKNTYKDSIPKKF
jgi:hypothetical protein